MTIELSDGNEVRLVSNVPKEVPARKPVAASRRSDALRNEAAREATAS
jgi:hypothetical protein